VKTAATMAPARRSSLWGAGVHWGNWSKRCAYENCDTSPLRSVFQGKGIRIFDEWICGAECLEFALRGRLSGLSDASRPAQPPRPARVPLGLMLFSRGYLSEEQFRTALEAHRNSGARVGDIALQFGFVNEEQVAAALASQWGYPVFSFKNAPAELPLLVPVRLMEMHQMLPVQYLEDGRKLLIGFATRVEFAVLQAVEKMLDCVASPCFVTAADFRTRVRRFPSGSESELIFDHPSSHLDIAHVVRSYSTQIQAEDIRYAVCREHLWVRLAGPQQRLELLFKLDIPQSPSA